MTAKDIHAAIVDELDRALEELGAEPELLGTIRAWGKELTDEEVLEHLKRFNTTGTIFDRVIHDFD